MGFTPQKAIFSAEDAGNEPGFHRKQSHLRHFSHFVARTELGTGCASAGETHSVRSVSSVRNPPAIDGAASLIPAFAAWPFLQPSPDPSSEADL